MSVDAPASRRARLRAQTTADILRVSRRQLAREGAGGLSLRAIARELGMGVSSLYRYFPSRDELLTTLLVEAFTAQADAVEQAMAGLDDPTDALRAASEAYRAWALAHPPEFALAYGTPVPGYAAPPERTIPVAVRVGDMYVDQLAKAWRSGRVDESVVARRAEALTPVERQGIEALQARRSYDVPIGLMSLTVDLFIRIHGYVVMEAFGQLRPMVADPDATFGRTVQEALDGLGLMPSRPGGDPKR